MDVTPRTSTNQHDRLVVLFDADCGICERTADQLRRWDRQGRLDVMPLQAASRDEREMVRSVADDHPLHDELHVLDLRSGTVRSGGPAFLEIISRLPGGRWPAAIARLPPAAWLVGLGYALVARNRNAISRALRLEVACQIPGVEA